MGFFNDLGKKTSQTTSKIAKETKLKVKIAENKGKIKSIYEEIGKKVYENHIRKEKVEIDEFILDDCSNIDNLSKEIEEARMEILELNNKKLCKNCSYEIEKEAEFCSKCGVKQNDEEKILEKTEEKLEKEKVSKDNKKEVKDVKKEKKNKKSENK